MIKSIKIKKHFGFSLAEMMVVMLMVAIVLAATAPMITRKISRERSSKVFDILPVDPTNAVEYVKGRNQRIYMNARSNGYVGIRETGDSIPRNSVLFGYNKYTASEYPTGFVGIGFNTLNSLNSVSIGYNAESDQKAVSIGYNAESDKNSIAIGYDAKTTKPSTSSTTGNAIAIGYNATAVANSTAIGANAKSQYEKTIVLGTGEDTVYIPGNLVVGKTTMFGANSITDDKAYPLYAKLRYGHDGDGAHITDIISVIEHNHADDYKGGGDTPMVMYGTSKPGAKVGPYLFPTRAWKSGHNDNQKICPPTTSSGNWVRIENGNCGNPTSSADELLYSDIRLKNVGEPFDSGLDELNKLKIYNFTYKKDTAKTPNVGVIAQDLQKIFPNAVIEDENGYLKIRWDEMFYSALNAIKELNTKIQTLTENMQNITNSITDIRSIIEKQQSVIESQEKILKQQQEELKNLTDRIEKLENKKQ